MQEGRTIDGKEIFIGKRIGSWEWNNIRRLEGPARNEK
jgi:hypothetical protein